MTQALITQEEMRERFVAPITNQAVAELIRQADDEALVYAIIVLGHYYEERAFAEQMLLKLADHANPWVRAMACKGFGHLARVHGYLDKRRVKPVLLREWRENPHQGDIEIAFDDIRHFLKWNLGAKKRDQKRPSRFSEHSSQDPEPSEDLS